LHSSRVGVGLAVGRVEERESLERPFDAPLQLPAGDPAELSLQHQILAAGRLHVRAMLLADNPDRASHPHRL